MSYSVQIKQGAAKKLARVQRQDRLRIVQGIDRLAEQPLIRKPLKGADRGALEEETEGLLNAIVGRTRL